MNFWLLYLLRVQIRSNIAHKHIRFVVPIYNSSLEILNLRDMILIIFPIGLVNQYIMRIKSIWREAKNSLIDKDLSPICKEFIFWLDPCHNLHLNTSISYKCRQKKHINLFYKNNTSNFGCVFSYVSYVSQKISHKFLKLN